MRLLLAILLAGSTLSATPARVSLEIRPRIMLSKGDIRVEAHVAPNAANRYLVIAWDSDAAVGSSLFQLDGADAAVIQTLYMRDQAPVHYLFEARLYGSGDKLLARAEGEIHVPDSDK